MRATCLLAALAAAPVAAALVAVLDTAAAGPAAPLPPRRAAPAAGPGAPGPALLGWDPSAGPPRARRRPLGPEAPAGAEAALPGPGGGGAVTWAEPDRSRAADPPAWAAALVPPDAEAAELRPGARPPLSLRVRSEAGAALAVRAAALRLLRPQPESEAPVSVAEAGADLLLVGAPDEPFELVLTTEAGVARQEVGPAARGELTLTVRAARLGGRLLGADVPERWRVRFVPDAPPPPGLYLCGRSGPRGRWGSAEREACAARDGSFALEVEPGVRGTLWAVPPAGERACARAQGVSAGPGELVLEVRPGLCAAGRVEAVEAHGAGGGRLRARQAGFEREADVGSDGAFRLEGLASGAWQVALVGPQGRLLPLGSVQAGTLDAVLPLPAAGAGERAAPR